MDRDRYCADALAQEIAGIKKESQEGQRKFYVLETNVKGLIFIRFTDPRMQPVPFVTRASRRFTHTCGGRTVPLMHPMTRADILEDLAATKQQKTKYTASPRNITFVSSPCDGLTPCWQECGEDVAHPKDVRGAARQGP